MNLFKNIVLFVLSIQEKMLTSRLNKTLDVKNIAKQKKYLNNGCFLNLDSIAENEKHKMEEELMLILKTANYEPTEVIKYIEVHGTKVYSIIDEALLSYIKEDTGFIYPQKGLKALYLSLITQKSFKFKTDEMFIFTNKPVDKYNFIYHFYNWYAYKHNIERLDNESQKLLKKYLYSDDITNLHLDDIYKLKNAIKQDKASIDFVIKLCQQYDGARNALEKIKDDGAKL
jgi:hypothetical protein